MTPDHRLQYIITNVYQTVCQENITTIIIMSNSFKKNKKNQIPAECSVGER